MFFVSFSGTAHEPEEILARSSRRLNIAMGIFAIPGAWSAHVWAASYYVATNGNDSSSTGSISAPYATVSKAIGKAAAGDSIFVRGGTYNLSSVLSISSSKVGTAAAPYHLLAYGNETPVLDFSGEASGARGIQLDGDYWQIKGLTIQNAHDNGVNVTGSNNTLEA